jgi:hypothetical protein
MKPLQKFRSNFNTPTAATKVAKSLIGSQSASTTRTNSGDVVLHQTASESVTDLRQRRATGIGRSQSAVDPNTGPSEGSRAA